MNSIAPVSSSCMRNMNGWSALNTGTGSGFAGEYNSLCMKNLNYPFFFIASDLRCFGISSIAYRSAVRGISFLCLIT
jgi:hypothetical protein